METKMAIAKGNYFLFKTGTSAGASAAAFNTIAALTASETNFSRALIDVTNKDNAGWVSNIDSQRSITFTGGGIYNPAVSAQNVLFDMFESPTPWNGAVVTLSGFSVSGAWQLSELVHTGNVNERHDFTFTLQSDGVMTVTKTV